MSDVVISIKPRFADLIFGGQKTVELRKSSARLQPGTRAVIYATSPRRAVVGEAVIGGRHQLPIDRLWERFGPRAAISESEFRDYYGDAAEGVAFDLIEVRRYREPVTLKELRRLGGGFQPPQSYMRVPAFLHALAERRFGWSVGEPEQVRLGA